MYHLSDRMKQYEKELLEKSQEKGIIPPIDIDSLDNTYINLTPDKKDKEKGKSFDMELQIIFRMSQIK